MTSEQRYDVLVVGAGPSGLSAARTAARLGFRTLVVERLSAAGNLAHPCHAIIAPAPDLISGRPLFGGLFLPQVDLWIPESLISASEAPRRCVSPAGLEFQTIFADSKGPSVVVEKGGLLGLMASQAESSGAEFLFGIAVTGLLMEGDKVAGVQTTEGDIRADVVIAAEGGMGQLCEQASLFSAGATKSYVLVLDLEVDAPGVRPEDVGQIVTLGKHPVFPGSSISSLVMPAAGRAHVTLMSAVEEPSCAATAPAALYFEQYQLDPRVTDYLAGARLVSQSSYLMPIQAAPRTVVANGFMAVGDAVAPSGRLGILASIYIGRQAALFAAEALDTGDVSAEALAGFDDLFRSAILPSLESEAKTTLAFLQMADGELDRLCAVLNALHLPVPFLDHRTSVDWDTAEWLLQQLPLQDQDKALVQRAMGSENGLDLLRSVPGVHISREAGFLA